MFASACKNVKTGVPILDKVDCVTVDCQCDYCKPGVSRVCKRLHAIQRDAGASIPSALQFFSKKP
jgi:hypothetical protein